MGGDIGRCVSKTRQCKSPYKSGTVSNCDKIVDSEFPQPILPQPLPTRPSPQPPKPSAPSSQESQATNKENAPPPSTPVRSQPLPPTQDPTATEQTTLAPDGRPPAIANLHQSIRNTLRTNFSKYPPHTVQRMAELLLRPKQHYRFLPPYLRALDRVINVQNNVKAYPLPIQPTPYIAGLPNGAGSGLLSSSAAAVQLGSDESLGGALLSPIPWLRESHEDSTGTNSESQMELQSDSTEIVEGPNGAGRVRDGARHQRRCHHGLGAGRVVVRVCCRCDNARRRGRGGLGVPRVIDGKWHGGRR